MSMASTSSSITTSPADNPTRYDVFLSFRGEDTRNSFTDHLYHALVRAGLHTFRDDDELERSEEVKIGIVRAIETSDASIIVLSANYANSTWCLDELCLILEERRVRNHFVLPVFYHVDPSDVRKQSKDFMIEVKSSGRWSVHNVNRWKAALTEVADLAGLVLSGPETNFLKKVVDN
ncbi:putative TIR domain-containing protein [Helianthus annuus]|nr:putative TIR domain-containing protein [Helianthus annuus]